MEWVARLGVVDFTSTVVRPGVVKFSGYVVVRLSIVICVCIVGL